MESVSRSLRSRNDLADFLVPQLFAVSKCPCGTCRTLGLEPLELPNYKGRSGKIAGLDIETKEHGTISILLHANDGFLVSWFLGRDGSDLVQLSTTISGSMGGSRSNA